MGKFKPPVCSTYYGDPEATHRVVTASPDLGYGVFGYYCEFDAYRVRNAIKNHGYNAVIEKHDPDNRTPGMHPVVKAHLAGMI